MAISVKVSGLGKTINRLRITPKFIRRGLAKGMKESGVLMKNEIRESIRGNKAEKRSVDTGRFLNSIDIRQDIDSVSIFSDVEHSIYLEFGVKGKFDERRHFRNSLSRNRTAIIKNIIDSIKSEI